jgi:ferrochelatase
MTSVADADTSSVRIRRPLSIVCEPRPSKTAVVLINIGTPDAPETGPVRRYLREFLSDPRVIDLPALLRALLLNLVILPFRPKRSAAAYRKVWTEAGSPLLVHARALERGLQARLPLIKTVTAMRYGSPSIAAAIEELVQAHCDQVVLVPLYPQHASASTGSALEACYRALGALPRVPSVTVLPELFNDPGFIGAICARFNDAVATQPFDHVLFSYHGLPLSQVQQTVVPSHRCLGADGASCCDSLTEANSSCYRAQCIATTRMLAASLELHSFSTSFQSRLGRAQWLLPNTEDHLRVLRSKGVSRLAVVCPSFVADCLETVEEIGVRAREQWTALGGASLTLVPCLNAYPKWIEALASAIERRLAPLDQR